MKVARINSSNPLKDPAGSLQRAIIYLDKIADHVPGVSAITNAICLVAKTALDQHKKAAPNSAGKWKDRPLISHLNKKKYAECVMLCIPLLNILVVIARDYPQLADKMTAPKPNPELDDLLNQAKDSQRRIENTIAEAREETKKMIERAEAKREQKRVEHRQTIASLRAQISALSNSSDDLKKRERLEGFITLYENNYQNAESLYQSWLSLAKNS